MKWRTRKVKHQARFSIILGSLLITELPSQCPISIPDIHSRYASRESLRGQFP